MIGILVVTHENLGDHLIRCASHVMGEKPEYLIHLGVFIENDSNSILDEMRALAQQLNTGDGVLILCDILGATPCNIASRLIQANRIACVAGVNLPMLVRTLTYRNEGLSTVVEKALSGGKNGVIEIPAETRHAN
ncbi:PTS system, ascorbate-specific IIA component [Nitrosomonas aestuarii]|uniref:PTS system, ascorbate-specific IIA component n=1 Tax=Nitrosomonas aestuarii TaxID=52441 RepID=A0A1I3XHF6_9PROT|nr:PTS fructose transporter subunit IIA [Nitrosomonas aestuarii]SFK18935.1 PTS system, ascorbate-specific IIA component [Nitrosomonas aestuarii]